MSSNVSRSKFDTAMLMPGSNDPTGTFWNISVWLHCAGTFWVSHFVFLCYADICSFEFGSSALMAVLPMRPGLEGKSI